MEERLSELLKSILSAKYGCDVEVKTKKVVIKTTKGK